MFILIETTRDTIVSSCSLFFIGVYLVGSFVLVLVTIVENFSQQLQSVNQFLCEPCIGLNDDDDALLTCVRNIIIIIIIIIIAVETLGPINESASDFFSLLANRISHHSGDEWETAFLFQRVSVLVLVQRFWFSFSKAATRFLCVWGLPGVMVTPTIFFYFFSPNPSGSLIPRVKNK